MSDSYRQDVIPFRDRIAYGLFLTLSLAVWVVFIGLLLWGAPA